MAVIDEIPNTKQGLITYIAYSEKRIHELKLEKARLLKRMQACQDRLAKYKESDNG